MSTIGFLGAGRLAQMLAPKAANAGWKVILSNSRGPDTLSELVAGIDGDVTAATPADMDQPMYMVVSVGLNTEIGGSDAFNGATMLVDYVHAYSLKS